MRSDIIVTGTLVKYNTKEFPQDNVALYSDNPEVMWANILSLNGEPQTKFIQSISPDRRGKLIDYALSREREKKILEGSKEADLFYQIVGRMLEYAVKMPTSKNNPNKAPASYNGLLAYSFEDQKIWLGKLLDIASRFQNVSKGEEAAASLKRIEAEAKDKVRACYPEKLYVQRGISAELR
jgi:hypothetical protein